MEILIKSAKIYSSESKFNLQTKDILIQEGVITKIEDNLSFAGPTINIDGLCITEGFVDLYAVVREPGNEHKETIANLQEQAAVGGFSTILGVSGSTPPLDNKAQIQYLINNSKGNATTILPVGTITHQQEGKEITEMFDMHQSGAVAFSDGKQALKNPELLKRALLYNKPFEGKIMVYCEDPEIAGDGMVTESPATANLGMKVRPALAEEIALQRNLQVAQYTDCPIHITGISSARGVEILRAAKANGVKVTADVHVSNLYFKDESCSSFDSRFKLLPPLRSSEDQIALVKGLKDGTIDAISSGHTPQDHESKHCEFDHAAFGANTLPYVFSAANKVLSSELSTQEILELLNKKPASIIGIQNSIEVGQAANITLFTLDAIISLEESNIPKTNNPFIGEELSGRVVGIVNNGKLAVNEPI